MLNKMRKELEDQRAQDPKFAQVPGWGDLSHFSAEAAHQKALAQMQHQEQAASAALQVGRHTVHDSIEYSATATS